MTAIIQRHHDGTEVLVAHTFGVDDAGKVIDDEGNALFDDPTVKEIVILRHRFSVKKEGVEIPHSECENQDRCAHWSQYV